VSGWCVVGYGVADMYDVDRLVVSGQFLSDFHSGEAQNYKTGGITNNFLRYFYLFSVFADVCACMGAYAAQMRTYGRLGGQVRTRPAACTRLRSAPGALAHN